MIERYSSFAGNVTAFSTNRQGGFSKGSYASFNANYYCNDNEADVTKNRELLCSELGIGLDSLIVPHQIHKTNIVKVDRQFLSKSSEEQKAQLEGVDALITSEHKVCIAISTADCVPVLLHDTVNNVAAAIHSGWRGTVQNIINVTIDSMVASYNSKPENIVAQIGPSISLNAFEVGDEVYDAFCSADFPMNRIARHFEKWHIDLWEACRYQLEQCGVKTENINNAEICTFSNPERFFSARRLGINSGRILSGIMLD